MTFLSPAWLFLLLLIPVVIALHLFRRHRRNEVVPSLLIWERLSRRVPRTIDLRVLKDLNLLLQILAVIAAALLMAEPVAQTQGVTAARDVVLILDTSASMNVAEEGGSRIDTARRAAQSFIEGVPAGSRLALIEAGARPRLVSGYTDNRDTVLNALRRLDANPVAGNPAAAVSMALALTSRESEIHLFTDGAFRGIDTPARLTVHRTGTARSNVGITNLSARPIADRWEILVSVLNAGAEPTTAVLEVSTDEQSVDSLAMELEPGIQIHRVLSVEVEEETALTATLADLPDEANALAADDTAYAVVDPTPSAKVLLVSSESYFLETMLSVMPETEVEQSATYPVPGYFDLVIFDGIEPPPLFAGNYVLFGVRSPDLPTTLGEPVEVDDPVSWDTDHPVFRFVDLSTVEVTQARPIGSAEAVNVIAGSGDLPLAFTYRREGLRMIGFTFALQETDLPLHVAFPLMVQNALSWLLPEGTVGSVRQAAAGLPYSLSLPIGDPVVVATPDGEIERSTVQRNPFEIADTSAVGVYQVRSQSVRKRFATSLTSEEESDVAPRFVGTPRAESELRSAAVAGRPIWRVLLAIVLLSIIADWFVWIRRS